MSTPVFHWAIYSRSSAGKSDPQSTIQPTPLECGGGEKMRAPNAEYVPAPPTISLTGGFGGGNSISSWMVQCIVIYDLSQALTDDEHPQCTEVDFLIVFHHVEGDSGAL